MDEPIRLDGWEVRFVKVSFGVLSASAIRVEDICEGGKRSAALGW